MKRPNSTTLRRDAEFMGPENIEKELKKIREELAWMRTEQKEIECWIHVALRDLVQCILENGYALAMIAGWHPNV